MCQRRRSSIEEVKRSIHVLPSRAGRECIRLHESNRKSKRSSMWTVALENNSYTESVTQAALTVGTKVIKLFLLNCSSNSIPLSTGLRIQVLPDMSYLPRCQKHQFAAFIADAGLLVVWDDDARQLLHRATKIEEELLDMVWQDGSAYNSGIGNKSNMMSIYATEVDSDMASELEANTDTARPLVLWQPISVCLTLICLLAATGSGCRAVAIEIYIDHNWNRLAFAFVWPLQVWLSLVRLLYSTCC